MYRDDDIGDVTVNKPSPKLIKSYKDKKHVDSFNDLYTIVPKDDPKKVAFRLDPRIAEEEDDPSDSDRIAEMMVHQ